MIGKDLMLLQLVAGVALIAITQALSSKRKINALIIKKFALIIN